MRALRLDRVALNVAELDRAQAFYAGALGFAVERPQAPDRRLASLLGVRIALCAMMRRGGQLLELTQTDPPGAPYPEGGTANDMIFQHCALVTETMDQAYGRLAGYAAAPVSSHGPQSLPGGIVAYKFRDPDGHPLELISFPKPDPLTVGGIDHSAIVVADADRSIAFYARLGLAVSARQVNAGPAQDALDGLAGVRVDVVALCPEQPAPHVELLGYRTPPGRAAPRGLWSDLAASRLVFVVDGLGAAADCLRRDPDGHAVMLDVEGGRAA